MRFRVLGWLLGLGCLTLRAHAAPDITVRVGYTTWRSATNARADDDALRNVARYLEDLSAESRRHFIGHVRFEVVLGNYYQILSWMRSGQIDAAITTPLVTALLYEGRVAKPIVEFASTRSPNTAQVCAADDRGNSVRDPVKAYRTYLQAALENARDLAKGRPQGTTPWDPPFETEMVTHLSSSGFITPLLYASDFLEQALEPAPGPGAPGPKPEAEPRVAAMFWTHILERATFRLAHSDGAKKASPGKTLLWFTYRMDPGCEPLSGPSVPLAPNDVLMARESVLNLLSDGERDDREGFRWALLERHRRGVWNGHYSGVQRVQTHRHNALREMAASLRRWPTLDQSFTAWFERGEFDFSADAVLQLLRQDAENSRDDNLALVLSGGGVKSVYQSLLLDELYARPDGLMNVGAGPPSSDGEHAPPLKVRRVIGTSGGAITAFFTAQITRADGQGQADSSPLLSRWIGADGEPKVFVGQLFAAADLLRYGSILAVLIFFLAASRLAGFRGAAPAFQTEQEPLRVLGFFLAAAIVLGPLLFRAFSTQEHLEDTPGWPAALYGLSIVGVHFAWTCARAALPPPSQRKDVVPRLFALAAGTVALSQASIVLPLVLGLLALRSAPRLVHSCRALKALRWSDRLAYATGLLLLAVTAAAAFAILALLVAAGQATTLEITTHYWLMLAVSAIAATILVHALAVVSARVSSALMSLHAPQGAGPASASRGWTLIGALGVGFLWWSLLASPAVYGNKRALRTLKANMAQTRPDLSADLVVTTNVLTPIRADGGETSKVIEAGPLYFCFPGSVDRCASLRGSRSFKVESSNRTDFPSIQPYPDIVFASGSPFPIFPPHAFDLNVVPAVSERDGAPPTIFRVRGEGIDGGYSHNEPVDAAAQTRSRQVLIIRSTPREAMPHVDGTGDAPAAAAVPRSSLGPLAANIPRLGSFMFSQSQEVDRSVRAGLFVASLTPHSDNGSFPFLMDFRKESIKKVESAARSDLDRHRRIGRIDSWGQPTRLVAIEGSPGNAHDFSMPKGGWTPEVRRMVETVARRSYGDRVAVFDLEEVCADGHLGELAFHHLIADLAFAGGDPQFWKHAPAPLQPLQSLWVRAVEDRSARWVAPGRPVSSEEYGAAQRRCALSHSRYWNEAHRQLFTAFVRHYEQMRGNETRDGEPTPEEWRTQLFGGLDARAVESLADHVLRLERRPATRLVVGAASANAVRIRRGFLVYREMQNLVRALRAGGWDVWVVTATEQTTAAAAAPNDLFVPRNRVIGARLGWAEGSRFGWTFPDVSKDAPRPPRQGAKTQALRDRGLTPQLVVASGRDLELLKTNEGVALVMGETKPDDKWHCLNPKRVSGGCWIGQPTRAFVTSR
jgi:predicted acylesterase/phospholipase RssA